MEVASNSTGGGAQKSSAASLNRNMKDWNENKRTTKITEHMKFQNTK
jgi:hypothetical protein